MPWHTRQARLMIIVEVKLPITAEEEAILEKYFSISKQSYQTQASRWMTSEKEPVGESLQRTVVSLFSCITH